MEEEIKSDLNACDLQELDCIVFPGLSFHQSMVFSYDKALFITPAENELCCEIIDMADRAHRVTVSLPIDGYSIPHANTSCFGPIIEGRDLPFLYVSSWNNNRQAFVFDFSFEKYSCRAVLVQVIDPNRVSKEILGEGCLDWVVDDENKYLYSIAYHLKGSSKLVEGNSTHIVKFRLPSCEKDYVYLNDCDIVEHFTVPVINIFQDKFYSNGRIYIAAGNPFESDLFPAKCIEVDLKDKVLVEHILPIYAEPEGFCTYKGIKWIHFGGPEVYNLERLINNRIDIYN